MKSRDAKKVLTNVMKEIKDHMKEVTRDVLTHEVLEVAKDAIVKHVHTDVYEAYTGPTGDGPVQYKRRKNQGGLADKDNIKYSKTAMQRYGKLVVENVAKFNPLNSQTGKGWVRRINFADGGVRTLSEHIISGWSKLPENPQGYMLPRPYMANASETIMSSGELDSAFEEGLARHGIFKKKT